MLITYFSFLENMTKSLLYDVSGSPRKEKVKTPSSILGSRPNAVPNDKVEFCLFSSGVIKENVYFNCPLFRDYSLQLFFSFTSFPKQRTLCVVKSKRPQFTGPLTRLPSPNFVVLC